MKPYLSGAHDIDHAGQSAPLQYEAASNRFQDFLRSLHRPSPSSPDASRTIVDGSGFTTTGLAVIDSDPFDPVLELDVLSLLIGTTV